MVAGSLPAVAFLSCLRGSEQPTVVPQACAKFLSCLRGSEQKSRQGLAPGSFLSCLRGSELVGLLTVRYRVFLSCLRGSEHDLSRQRLKDKFLSCLRGSEPGKESCSPLINRHKYLPRRSDQNLSAAHNYLILTATVRGERKGSVEIRDSGRFADSIAIERAANGLRD